MEEKMSGNKLEPNSKTHFSASEFANEIDRSTQYVWALIRTGRVKAERIGKVFIIHKDEVKRVKLKRPAVSRKDYRSKSTKRE